MWVVHWGLLLRLPWRAWVCPCEGQVWRWGSCLGRRGSGSTRSSGELAAGAAGNIASRRVWQPVLANKLQCCCLQDPTVREAWQDTVYRVTKSWTRPKWPCVHVHKTFLPVAALPQWGLSLKVVQLLGLCGAWCRRVCRDTDCLCRRSCGPSESFSSLLQLVIRRPLWPVFLRSSACSGTSFLLFLKREGAGESLKFFSF